MTEHVGLTTEFFVGINDKLDQIHAHQKEIKAKKSQVFQSPILADITASPFDNISLLAPPRGNCWSVRRLTAFGFTAGTVTVLIDGLEPVWVFSAAGSETWGRGELLLQPGQKLIVTFTGITGNVYLAGAADEFPFWYLQEYIG